MSSSKRRSSSNDDGNEPPAKQKKLGDVNEAIYLLQHTLKDDCGGQDKFNQNFAKLTAYECLLKPQQIRCLNEAFNGLNFLMLACKYGSVEAVNFLIRCGVNLNKVDVYGRTASDYALGYECFECLHELLKAEAPFPQDFGTEYIKGSNTAIDELVSEMENFHENIRGGMMDDVKIFVGDNPNVRFAYDKNNRSALAAALEFKQFKIYNFLCNNYFEAGVDSENHKIKLSALEEKEKKHVRNRFREKLEKSVDDHVLALLAKSRSFPKRKQNLVRVLEFFEALNDIPEIFPILKLVAKSEKTDIVFYFNDGEVFVIDPTAEENTFGLTYHLSGYILIGAKRADNEVLATLAHELTHWALQLVYKNECQPFFAENDEFRKEKYEKVVENYKRSGNWTVECNEIQEVFDSNLYDQVEVNKELIVRVPHLLALHKDNQEIRHIICGNYEDLFSFFDDFVLPDIKLERLRMDQKEEIVQLNKSFGLLEKSLNLNMLAPECDKEIDLDNCSLIKSTTPELVIEVIAKKTKKKSAEFAEENVFVELEQLSDPKNLERLMKVAKLDLKPKIFVVDQKNNLSYQPEKNKLFEKIRELKVILILSAQKASQKQISESGIEVNFEWEDLNEDTKARIKYGEIDFQDHKVRISDIVKDEKLLKELPLEILLNPSMMKLKSLNETLPEKPRAFIKRTFSRKAYDNSAENQFDSLDLCDFVLQNKTVLIADSAGMGKSTSAAQLARDLKARNEFLWVVFIDLKQHTKVFFPDQKPETEVVDVSFFTEKLLQLKSKFESKLFESFYKNENLIFIIDGFDEISPKYKVCVLNILQAIKNSKNHLLVTTRPHFTTELEQKLETKAIKLLPLDKKDQIVFLIQFWKSNNDLKSRIIFFLQKFETDDFCATPIHIFMIAEVFGDEDLTNIDNLSLNIHQFYEKFFKIKLKIWNEEKGNLAIDDSVALQNTFPPVNWKQILSRFAVEQIFSPETAEKLEIPKVSDEIIDETIARVGIVAFSSEGTAQFTHRTYAEFFVADLIASQAFKKVPKYEFVELFAELILKTENFEQIWKFLNDKLEIMADFDTEALATTFGRIVEEIEDWREIKNEGFYGSSIKNMPSCSKLISFILEKLNVGNNFRKKLLIFFWKNFGDQFEYFSIIWPSAQSIRDQREKILMELSFTKVHGRDFITKALEHEVKIKAIESERASKVVLEYAGSSLSEEDFMKLFFDERGRNESIGFMINLDEENFFEFWALAEKKLDRGNLKKLALSKDFHERTILHLIADNNGEVLKWLQILKSLLTPQEFVEHLSARNKYLDIFIINIVRDAKLDKLKSCWKFIEENSSLETQKKLLLSENEFGKSSIVESCFYKDKSMADFIFDVTDILIQKTEGKTFIDWLRDQDRLVNVIQNMASFSIELFDKCSAMFDAEEFRSLLTSKNSQLNFNVFHCFVGHQNSSSIQLWNRIVEEIDDLNEVKVLLFEEAETGFEKYSNVFFHAAHFKNPFLIELLEWCKTTFDHEFITKIFTAQDEDNYTLLHFVAQWGDENLISKCFEFVSNNFEQEEQRKILRMRDTGKELPIETSFDYNEEVTDILAEFMNFFSKKKN